MKRIFIKKYIDIYFIEKRRWWSSTESTWINSYQAPTGSEARSTQSWTINVTREHMSNKGRWLGNKFEKWGSLCSGAFKAVVLFRKLVKEQIHQVLLICPVRVCCQRTNFSLIFHDRNWRRKMKLSDNDTKAVHL